MSCASFYKIILPRFLTYHGGKFYITDLGRDRIYILESKEKDDNPGVQVLGETGKRDGQFRDPAGLVVDDLGYVCSLHVFHCLRINKLIHLRNMIIADSKNYRLQLYSKERKWIRNVKVIILNLIQEEYINELMISNSVVAPGAET